MVISVEICTLFYVYIYWIYKVKFIIVIFKEVYDYIYQNVYTTIEFIFKSKYLNVVIKHLISGNN